MLYLAQGRKQGGDKGVEAPPLAKSKLISDSFDLFCVSVI